MLDEVNRIGWKRSHFRLVVFARRLQDRCDVGEGTTLPVYHDEIIDDGTPRMFFLGSPCGSCKSLVVGQEIEIAYDGKRLVESHSQVSEDWRYEMNRLMVATIVQKIGDFDE